VNFGKEIFEELKKKGLIKEGEQLQQQEQSQEGISEKLKKLVVERVKGEEKPN